MKFYQMYDSTNDWYGCLLYITPPPNHLPFKEVTLIDAMKNRSRSLKKSLAYGSEYLDIRIVYEEKTL